MVQNPPYLTTINVYQSTTINVYQRKIILKWSLLWTHLIHFFNINLVKTLATDWFVMLNGIIWAHIQQYTCFWRVQTSRWQIATVSRILFLMVRRMKCFLAIKWNLPVINCQQLKSPKNKKNTFQQFWTFVILIESEKFHNY